MEKAMYFLLPLLFAAGCQENRPDASWTLHSPEGRLAVQVDLTECDSTGGLSGGSACLQYSVFAKEGEERSTVLLPSPLGIIREDNDFSQGLEFVSASKVKSIDENYSLLHGKRRQVHSVGSEQILEFSNPQGARLQLVLRAYDDGIAFRYRFPEKDAEPHTVAGEATGFRLPAGSKAFIQPHDIASKYTPAYERYFLPGVELGTEEPESSGWSFPALFECPEQQGWVLITESDLDKRFFGSRLSWESSSELYQLRVPAPDEGMGFGEIEATGQLPWETPWRVLIVGSLNTIVESALVDTLARPSVVKETGWIRPGRVSWSWWSEPDSPKNLDQLKRFVDLASEMGWEYSLVDANWTEMSENAIPDLVAYAAKKGVGILLWYNSGGPHNEVTEKPRDRMFERERRRREFEWMQNTGIKGAKVDFFQSDKQVAIQQYLQILEDAADYQLMINFHGCTLPRGWARTYPHLMTMEAVRGAESYIFDATYPETSFWHNTILPFTRNVVGPMDYTPVTFSDNRYPHLTTFGHELALSVVYESGWIHFADRPEGYQNLPSQAKTFLRQVPVAWDDIRLLNGRPAQSVVLARRKGDIWYVGGLNGEDQGKTVTVDFSFLKAGDYSVTWIGDGSTERDLQAKEFSITSAETRDIEMLPRGGFVLRIAPI